jgi:ornithine cyclodeaminase
VTGFRVFGAAEIRAAVGLDELIEPVARALVEFSQGHGESPHAVFAPAGRDGDVHVKGCVFLRGALLGLVSVMR